ncbi:DUF998 domain-containing protein [Microlunatus soli]|uniref:DUF998 domain-containing protein n=1 Tax=Microlunatus soli TaxID=630515 RepID=A0A1H1Y5F9_9ACTN|nr:DUF998 domain-containing protein [Microlunatus soli]SDT16738.1 Protein of unknown function [Microlunatus soli]
MNRSAVAVAAAAATRRGRDPQRTGRAAWSVIAVLILVSYNTRIWWQPLNGDPAILRGYLSELAAADQPHHLFFRAGDLVAAVLILVTAVTGLARVGRGVARRWWAAAYAGLTLLAASIAAGAIFPMDCSPSLDRSCAVAEHAGAVTPAHDLHTLAGVGVEIGLLGALVAGSVALRRVGRPRLSWLLVAMIVIEVIGLSVITGFFSFGVRAIAYPQVLTVLNASTAGALAALGQAVAALHRPRGGR